MKWFLLFAVILLLGTTIACAEVESIFETQDKESIPRDIYLKEYFLAGSQFSPKVIELNKIQQWMHSDSKKLSFKSLNPPYVVNAAIRDKTSDIVMNLEIRVYKKSDPNKFGSFPITGMGGRQAFIITEKGDYYIDVKSVGCVWWCMIGHETEGLR